VLTAAALLLRIWGIGWGLPNQKHLFSYHPDEGVNLIQGVLDNGVPRPHLDLAFYNYGTLYFYLWQGAVAVNRSYGLVTHPSIEEPGRAAPDSVGAMLLVGRILSAVMGALTLLPLFSLGRRLFGDAAGLTACALYAVMPVAVVHAHFATVDVPGTFFTVCCLAVSCRLLTTPHWKTALAAGVLAGLSAAVKYNLVLVFFAPTAALLLCRCHTKWGPAPFVAVLGGLIGGFLLACPAPIINPTLFWENVRYEAVKSQQGMGLLFADTGWGWWYHLRSSLWYGVGGPMTLLAAAGVLFAVFRRTRQDWFLLAFVVPYYLLIGFAQVRFARYTLPLLPLLALLAARTATEPFGERSAAARAAGAATAFAGVVCLALTFTQLLWMTSPDPRDLAEAHLRRTLPASAVVAFATTPWYYTPPLAPEWTAAAPSLRRQAALTKTGYTVRLPEKDTEWDIRVLDEPLPDAVIISNIESDDALRVKLPAASAFFQRLQAHFSKTEFAPAATLPGLAQRRFLPNDLLYIQPRITVYTRRQQRGEVD
jgi:hypothetical protein